MEENMYVNTLPYDVILIPLVLFGMAALFALRAGVPLKRR
jgi:hypothetical protein